jgi:hypothetical protein
MATGQSRYGEADEEMRELKRKLAEAPKRIT